MSLICKTGSSVNALLKRSVLNVAHLQVRVNEDVRRFDVSMGEPERMEIFHSVENLREDVFCVHQGHEATLLEVAVQTPIAVGVVSSFIRVGWVPWGTV